MKNNVKIPALAAMIAVLAILSSCSEASASAPSASAAKTTAAAAETQAASQTSVNEQAADITAPLTQGVSGEVDVDLTKMSATMVYSTVYDMTISTSDYIGKSVRMKGPFSVYYDDTTNIYYLAVIISDATACCSQGIEFITADGKNYTDGGFPEIGDTITVSGIFNTYTEGEALYCRLENSVIEKA